MTIAQARAALRRKQVSSVELVETCLKAISARNPELNAFITITAEEALAAARAADRELAEGRDRGPLHGIPIAHKDLFDTAGVRTTYGSKIFANHVPDRDAALVKKLKDAGAVSLGKLGLHELAYGITSNNPHFGAVRNPFDPSRIPGGSSGGSGVAVATGMALMATGTDTGGSIRIPASFCGIAGLKPTFGLISTEGCRAVAESLDTMGPMAATAEDVALSMEAIAVPSKPFPLDAPAGLRLGIPENFFFDHALPEVSAAVDQAAKASGFELVRVRVDGIEELHDIAFAIILAEGADSASDIFFGSGDRRADIGPDILARYEAGRAQDPAKYLRAQRERVAATRRFLQVFDSCDVLLTPATPVPAPKLGEDKMTLGGREYDLRVAVTRLARPVNVTGVPALALPGGRDGGGLPIGLQLLGRRHEDAIVVAAGVAIERGLA
ncbi:MAG: amidase [Bryobacteraceae bacterium]|nr:amidase [Bryobacteraceae bacterium]